MPYPHVPASVEAMATAALEWLPGCTLTDIAYHGAYSAYLYTYTRDTESVSVRLGYDFGLGQPENTRGQLLAREIEKHLPAAVVPVDVPPQETLAAVEFEPLPEITENPVTEVRESKPVTVATPRNKSKGGK